MMQKVYVDRETAERDFDRENEQLMKDWYNSLSATDQWLYAPLIMPSQMPDASEINILKLAKKGAFVPIGYYKVSK